MRSLSVRTEFVVVVALAFGLPIYASLIVITSSGSPVLFSDQALWTTVVYETIVAAALAVFLKSGWTAQDIGLAPSFKDTAVGVPLLVGAYGAYFILWCAFIAVTGGIEAPEISARDLTVSAVLIASCVNGLFEEVFVCGYVITAVKLRRSATFAVNVSLAIRATYHLYQGAVGVLSIVPMGLIFGHWFARTGRLWPLVVAHVLADIIGFMYYVN